MARTPISIRLARDNDLDELLDIENRAFAGDRLTRRTLRYLIRRARSISLIAQIRGSVVGYVIVLLRKGSSTGRIYSLAVDPDWRGKQIGARLLVSVEKRLRARHRVRMSLEVRADNQSAIHRYLESGYAVCGQVSGYYEDGEAALKMEKSL